jgi:PAS domain S-box-containing protein
MDMGLRHATGKPEQKAGHSMQLWARRLRLGVTTLLALSCLIAMVLLAQAVQAKLVVLQRANSDNTQWVMMQTEVEVLRLQAAVAAARENPSSAQLDEVRRWFNVFYSRVAMLEQSPVYAPLLTRPDYGADHARLRGYLDATVPLIDAPDTQLAGALGRIGTPLPDLRATARGMILNALSEFTAQSDMNREAISTTLVRLAVVTGALLLIVAGVAAALALQFRRSEAQKHALADAGARLSTIVATSADAIVVTDPGGVIREFNPAAEAIFGLPAAAARGQNALALLFAEGPDGPQQRTLIAALRDPGADAAHPLRIEVDARRADGRCFPAEVSIARSQIAEAGLVVAFVRDISTRREAEVALTRALDRAQAGEKAKAEFLAVMSHEMRTPLNGLIGSMELLRRTPTDPAQKELLCVMQASGDILLGHVNSVLNVSRAEAGMIHPDHTRFDPDRLLEETVANQAGLAAAAGNRITLSHPTGPLGPVMGDPGRLRQILLNLIGNAVKFTRNGDITIEVERLSTPDAAVEIRVSDTGIGIAEADLDRIFDDFVTLDASYGRSAGGTGLGLGIARRLARALGGEIGVESIEGEGSLFWLRLPLPPADLSAIEPEPQGPLTTPLTGPQPAPQLEDPPPGPPLSVLLVEDNTINRFLLRRFLESGGHRVTEATDGVEAVDCARTTVFDVILMDISMPRMDGIAATQAIRAGQGLSRDARIIALTAHALPQELARFHAAGMAATLTKPIARLALLQALAGRLPDPQTPPMPREIPIIDDAVMADLVGQIGPQTAIPLITRLIAEGDTIIADLATRHPQGDAAEMAALCHQLVGSSGTFGTRGLYAALRDAETALKLQAASAAGSATDPATDPDHAPDPSIPMAALAPVWQATRAALSAELTRLVAYPAGHQAQGTEPITAS